MARDSGRAWRQRRVDGPRGGATSRPGQHPAHRRGLHPEIRRSRPCWTPSAPRGWLNYHLGHTESLPDGVIDDYLDLGRAIGSLMTQGDRLPQRRRRRSSGRGRHRRQQRAALYRLTRSRAGRTIPRPTDTGRSPHIPMIGDFLRPNGAACARRNRPERHELVHGVGQHHELAHVTNQWTRVRSVIRTCRRDPSGSIASNEGR